MDKLVDSMSFSEDWKVTLLDEGTGLEKTAAASEVVDFTKNIKKDPKKFYLHINAMGAGEYYGSNRNGDYFPEDNLLQWYKTFETSPAHVFRHHVSKNPEIAIGKVIFSYYNPRMHRVELIAEVDRQKGAAELQAIERGEFPMTSMACHTPYDMCSVCGNKAHTRAQYCEHLSSQLNKVLPDGRKVMSMNVGPLKFFDISIVIRPADVTSSVLQKVASDIPDVSSAEMAELEGISYGQEKRASLKKEAVEKAADLIKEIPGEVDSVSDGLQGILDRIEDPGKDLLAVLRMYPLEDVITTFAYLGINPSVEYLSKILLGKYARGREEEVSQAVMAALHRYGIDSIPDESADIIPEITDTSPNPHLVKLLAPYQHSSGYGKSFVEKRAAHTGYANLQPGRSEVERSDIFRDAPPSEEDKPLLVLAGAALIAKILISSISGMSKVASLSTSRLMDIATLKEIRG